MKASTSDSKKDERIDRFGMVASSLCALHCAVCALLPAAFGALGLGMLLNQEAEWAFTIIAITFALGALVFGWRQNRSYAVAGLLSLGIVGLLASRGLEMGSDHHHGDDHHGDEVHADAGHHDDEHATEKHHDDHGEPHDDHGEKTDAQAAEHSSEEHHDDHHDAHADEDTAHSDSNHMLGASVGVLGGIFLLFGHLMNIRTSRRIRTSDDCCD
jgi:hypothetical protein